MTSNKIKLCVFSFRYYPRNKEVRINQILDQLKVLRNFGHVLTNLRLHANCTFSRDDLEEKIESYVIKYCSKSLQTLRIRCPRIQTLFKSTETPFTNLKNLNIKFSVYKSQNLWRFETAAFPNLETLELVLNRMDSTKLEIQAFPALKCFSFDGSVGNYNDIRRYADIVEMIKLNKQLEKLELALLENYDQSLVKCLSQYLPNLRCLNLIMSGTLLFSNASDSYHFNTVTDFGLFNIPATFSNLPFTFDKLERFTISTSEKTYTEHLNHVHIWNFIAKNKNLISIFLHGKLNGTFITNYEHVFTNVEELYINSCEDLPIYTILDLLKKNSKLKKFSISGSIKLMNRTQWDCQNLCEIFKMNEIEFKVIAWNHLELFITRPNNQLITCFLKCDCNICDTYTIQNIKLYNNDKLKCYNPPVQEYYSKYYCPVKY